MAVEIKKINKIDRSHQELVNTPFFNSANLQGYWRLEANGADSSPNGYNLVAGNDPSFASGMFGNGADFESGSSQYLKIADASCPNLEISGSQTWTAWVKVESLDAIRRIMTKYNGSGGYAVFFIRTTGVVSFQLSGLAGYYIDSTATVSTGTWYFVAGVWDAAAGKLKIWVNDSKVENTGNSGTHGDTNADFRLGASFSGGNPTLFFDGLIDDAAIFNRALTDAEIGLIYNSGIKKISETTLSSVKKFMGVSNI